MFLQRLILLLIICICEGIWTSMHTGVHSILKRVADPLELDLEVFVRCLYGCCEPNLGLLQEQDTLSTTGPSLQTSMFPYSKKYSHNLKRILMIFNKKIYHPISSLFIGSIHSFFQWLGITWISFQTKHNDARRTSTFIKEGRDLVQQKDKYEKEAIFMRVRAFDFVQLHRLTT